MNKEARPVDGDGRAADQEALDAEIARLPEKFRAIVALCYLEGLSQDQAAARLGWPSGTVRGRLSQARDLLRSRLARRGLVLPAAAGSAGFAPLPSVALPGVLVESTVRAAMRAASGATAPAVIGGAGAASTALARRAAGGLAVAHLKYPLALVAIGLTALGSGGVGRAWLDRETPPAPALSAPAPPEEEVDLTPHRESSLVARPLAGIEIDGDLSDWPSDIDRHTPRKFVLADGVLGHGGLGGLDLADNPDLAVAFSVGYSASERLLYLAVTVRDDRTVIGHDSYLSTDAVEVYIDGLMCDRKLESHDTQPNWTSGDDLSLGPVQQYAAIPGAGRIYGTSYRTNPVLFGGRLERTRTRMAYRRDGDVTTYEWAIEPFDRYPDRPTEIVPGKRVGFDLAIAERDVPRGEEKDANDLPAWVYWGPTWQELKLIDAGNLGEVILGPPDPSARR